MSPTQLSHLIHMANQIADNQFRPDTSAEQQQYTVDLICGHIKRFWARSMKQQIIAYAREDGAELRPLALQAVRQLAQVYPQLEP